MNNIYITKLQYRNYETGEFTDCKERTLPEIEKLILGYPWLEECHNTPVELTAPSVTVENGKGCFLKISHYYHQKFSIYYLDNKSDCYKKIVSNVQECLPTLQAFCKETLSIKDFKEDYHRHPNKHFETKSFRYGFRVSAIISLIFLSLIVIGFMAPLLLLFTLKNEPSNIPSAVWISISFYMLIPTFFGWGTIMGWKTFLNHYKQYKNHFLKIANGCDSFSFGTNDNFKTYNKSDIISVKQIVAEDTIIKDPRFGRYSPQICYYIVTFANREQIKISSFLYPNAGQLYFLLKRIDIGK